MLGPSHRVAFVCAVATASILTLVPGRGVANGPEIGLDAGHAVPIASSDVSLESESVTIDLPLGAASGSMHCQYRLRNPSHHTVRVPMAFVIPSAAASSFPGMPAPSDDPALGLTVQLVLDEQDHRRALNVRRMPVAEAAWRDIVTDVPDSLPTWVVPIPPETTVTLAIASRVKWTGGSDGETSGEMLTYCTRPARLWKGPIKEAVIEFRVGEAAAALLRAAKPDSNLTVRLEPTGSAWTNRGVRWRFRDWEPDADCVLSVQYQLAERDW